MKDESNCQKHCKSQSVSVASRIYAFSVHTDQFVSLDICLPLLSLGAYDHPSTSGKRQFNLSVRRTIHIIYESRKTQFIEEKNDKTFRKVTAVVSNEGTSSLVIANEMSFNDLGSSLDLKFKNGSLHQGILEDEVKIISSFGELKLPLDKEITKIKGLSLSKLFDYSSNSSNSEILWNISIPITIFVLLILGVTMSKVEPRQGRLSVMLPAIAIYILPPDIDTLKERLQKRGEDEEKTIMLRVASSEQELQYAKYADYTLINDNFEQALDSLLAIILFNKVEKKYINKWTQQILNLNKHVV